MKRMCDNKANHNSLWLTVMIWLLIFQNPLEEIWSPFSYIDESVALIGTVLVLYDIVFLQKCRMTKEQLWIGIPLVIFIIAGLSGNLLYQYQPPKSVVIDLYTNLKFYFAIGTGWYLFKNAQWESLKKSAVFNTKTITIILFSIFLADRFADFYPAEVRYGIKSAVLFYSHPTYLAGAMAFLVILLTVFFDRKNIPYIAMALIMMTFTLRSKSIASAAGFFVIFIFFVVWKRKLKLWHFMTFALLCIVIAWPQIHYYFIELGGKSTRSVILLKSFTIMKDYFPVGTGFATYASAEAAKHFSPVYDLYNFEFLLRFEQNRQWIYFLNDCFWPIIFGQTGAIGTIAYICAMGYLFKIGWKVQNENPVRFAAILYGWIYLLICSLAEPAFNNAMGVPVAVMMGYTFRLNDESKRT